MYFSNFVDFYDLEAVFVPLSNKGINMVSPTDIKANKAIALSYIVTEIVPLEQPNIEGTYVVILKTVMLNTSFKKSGVNTIPF